MVIFESLHKITTKRTQLLTFRKLKFKSTLYSSFYEENGYSLHNITSKFSSALFSFLCVIINYNINTHKA